MGYSASKPPFDMTAFLNEKASPRSMKSRSRFWPRRPAAVVEESPALVEEPAAESPEKP